MSFDPLDHRGRRIVPNRTACGSSGCCRYARNFEPGFCVEHFIKDMRIALQEAEAMNLSLPWLALVKQMYLALQAQGHGRKGTQALLLALEAMNGISR